MSNLTSELLVSRFLRLVPFSFRDRIKTIPGLAQLQRAIVSQTLDGREFEYCVDAGPAQGITFRVKMPEDKGIWTGTYEIDFAKQLAANVTPRAVTYDIGGWHGFFAGVMAAQGASQVHVFEPLPANAERIRDLVSLNPERKITLHKVAVGETEGEMDLLIMPYTSMAKLEASTFQPDATAAERVRVKVRSIDTMIENGEIAPPALIKIDVEGAELLVLKGAAAALRHYRPVVFAEVHSSRLLKECKDLLEAIGYRVDLIDHDTANALSKDVFQIHAIHGATA
jgi:FkbM family methyltransferase